MDVAKTQLRAVASQIRPDPDPQLRITWRSAGNQVSIVENAKRTSSPVTGWRQERSASCAIASRSSPRVGGELRSGPTTAKRRRAHASCFDPGLCSDVADIDSRPPLWIKRFVKSEIREGGRLYRLPLGVPKCIICVRARDLRNPCASPVARGNASGRTRGRPTVARSAR